MSSLSARTVLILIASAFIATGCSRKPVPETAAAVEQVLAGGAFTPDGPHKSAVSKDVREFYTRREGATAWTSKLSPSKQATDAIDVLQNAASHGLQAADYNGSEIAVLMKALEDSKDKAPDRLQRLSEFDVRLTAALLSLGRDVAIGRTTPAPVNARWKARRTPPDFVGTLAGTVGNDLTEWLGTMRPTHSEYTDLQKALADLRQKQTSDAGAKSSTGYDTKTPDGIRAFQTHYGIKVTGVADPATVAAMNVPVTERITQIEINLERWRWMPNDFGARHLLVNIPQYQVNIRDNNKTVQDIRVVVGKRGNETPIFSSDMETVVFSPYWNIPDSIVEGETAPAMAKDPNYLAKNQMEILRVSSSGATRVEPSDVNWDDPAELRQLAIRQRPGAGNALGHVKFLFPNENNVYLHDTPSDNLFARPGRAFSHGCVRVEEPETLAKYVLRDDPEWTVPKISEAMHSGVEKHVKLKQPLPVHIVYFTAWVDDKGGLHFQPDVYGYDAKQIAAQNPS